MITRELLAEIEDKASIADGSLTPLQIRGSTILALVAHVREVERERDEAKTKTVVSDGEILDAYQSLQADYDALSADLKIVRKERDEAMQAFSSELDQRLDALKIATDYRTEWHAFAGKLQVAEDALCSIIAETDVSEPGTTLAGAALIKIVEIAVRTLSRIAPEPAKGDEG